MIKMPYVRFKSIADILFLLIVAFSPVICLGQAVLEGGGLLYGDKAGFMLEAPKNWMFDNTSGKTNGLDCVMYPKGGSWEGSPIAIYANISGTGERTLEQFVADDIKTFGKEFKAMKYKAYKKAVANKKLPYIAVDFDGVNNGYERVVYVYAEKHVCMVVLTTKEKALMDRYKDAVYEVIRNVFYMHVDDTTKKSQ